MKTICIKAKTETWRLNVADINYIEQEARSLIFNTPRGIVRQMGKLDAICKKLGHDFFRCHSYCTINFSKIFGLKDCTVIFDDGSSISLGPNAFRYTRKAFHAYLDRIECDEALAAAADLGLE